MKFMAVHVEGLEREVDGKRENGAVAAQRTYRRRWGRCIGLEEHCFDCCCCFFVWLVKHRRRRKERGVMIWWEVSKIVR